MSAAPQRPAQPGAPTSPRRRRRWLKIILLTMVGGFLAVVALAGVVYANTNVPAASGVSTAQATVIRYSDGTEMASLGANRVDVPLADVPEFVQKAVLSAEDRNYYSEPGISPTGILRAAVANLKGGGISQGASTITQQYAKNAFLTQERTFTRKFKEIFIAVKLDRTRTKDQVLEDYLNTVYFGRGALGIETAAKAYFGVSAKDLSPDQGIVLAALLRGPALYDPASHPERAQGRYDYVYAGMADNGWLPAGTPTTVPTVLPIGNSKTRLGGPVGFLVRQAESELAAQGFSEDYLRQAGLDVTTTIDKKKQDAAVAAVKSVLGDAPKGLLSPLIAIEPATGRIVAEYAGADYNTDQFNSVTDSVAQAGSTFKAYVLAAALSQGIELNSTWDGSSPYKLKGYGKNDEVTNYQDANEGTNLTLVQALAKSTNTVFVPLGIQAGLRNVGKTAVALGIRESDVDVAALGASISLGSAAVHPIDQAVAFATLANHGVRATPHILDSVRTHDGKVLAEIKTKTTDAVDTVVADQTTFALQAVVTDGTAQGAGLDGGRPAAGKTGTTNNSTAAWFAGYTPQLAAVTAFFYRDSARPVTGVAGLQAGVEITGGSGPAKVWKAFMDAALQGEPVQQFATVDLPTPQPTFVPTRSPIPIPTRSLSPTPSVSPSPSESPTPSPTPSEIVLPLPGTSPAPRQPTPSPTGTTPVGSGSPTAGSSPAPAAAAAGTEQNRASPQPLSSPAPTPTSGPAPGG